MCSKLLRLIRVNQGHVDLINHLSSTNKTHLAAHVDNDLLGWGLVIHSVCVDFASKNFKNKDLCGRKWNICSENSSRAAVVPKSKQLGDQPMCSQEMSMVI